MNVRTLSVALLALAAVSVSGSAQQTALVSLFDFGTSVRATGMGGAFAGLADDEQALLFNPAGLALLDRLHAHATVQSHLGRASVNGLFIALPALGAGVQLYGVGGLTRRDDQDNEGEAFGYGQAALLGAGALRLGSLIGVPSLKDLGVGLRFKFLSVNTLAAGSGATFALDPSVLWEVGGLRLGGVALQAIRVGVALENLGPGITYGSGYQEALGFGARLGGSLRIQDVALGLELNTMSGLHLGAEFRLPLQNVGALAVRAGMHTGNGFTLTLGLGFVYQEWVRLDYAYASHGQLGGSHQLAAAVAFKVGRLF